MAGLGSTDHVRATAHSRGPKPGLPLWEKKGEGRFGGQSGPACICQAGFWSGGGSLPAPWWSHPFGVTLHACRFLSSPSVIWIGPPTPPPTQVVFNSFSEQQNSVHSAWEEVDVQGQAKAQAAGGPLARGVSSGPSPEPKGSTQPSETSTAQPEGRNSSCPSASLPAPVAWEPTLKQEATEGHRRGPLPGRWPVWEEGFQASLQPLSC